MLIRKLHGHERGLFTQHLQRLSGDDRRFRFAHPAVSDATIESYVASIAEDDLIVGAFEGDILVGGVHVALAHGVAEIGVSVDPRHRGQGLGGELFNRATRWARNRRAEKLYTLCLADNRAMNGLARKLGMDIKLDCGTAEAFLILDPPDLVTVSDEMTSNVDTAMHEWVGLVSSCRDLWLGTSHASE